MQSNSSGMTPSSSTGASMKEMPGHLKQINAEYANKRDLMLKTLDETMPKAVTHFEGLQSRQISWTFHHNLVTFVDECLSNQIQSLLGIDAGDSKIWCGADWGCTLWRFEIYRCPISVYEVSYAIHQKNVSSTYFLESHQPVPLPLLQYSLTLHWNKRDLMLKTLDETMPKAVTWTHPEGGLFLWVELPVLF